MTTQSLNNLTGKIWFDGRFVDWHNAKISLLTHSLHYGIAVWEGLRAYQTEQGTAIFRLDAHTQRLFNSAKIMGITMPYDKATLNQAHCNVLKENNLAHAYMRPMIFYGSESLGVAINENLSVHAAVTAWQWGDYLGAGAIENGVRIGISSYTRPHPNSNLCKAKATGNYTSSVLAANEARKLGYDEALMLDYQGYIAEGSAQNFFIVRNNILYTPDTSSILEGITRASIITIAQDMGLTVQESRLTRDEAYSADEAFFTGTAAEITPICEIDNRIVGEGKPGEITKKLLNIFTAITHGNNQDYAHWLHYI
ncbi:MAG: branched-chain amino acid transaminase [Gammaproteobacteria bacterium]|nr:branched-chain amino acid transaminase [Gammaproteobacteria bacterium]